MTDGRFECQYDGCDETFDETADRLEHSLIEHLGKSEAELKRNYPSFYNSDDDNVGLFEP